MFTDLLSTISLAADAGAWVILIICLADLTCGLAHWFEDNYGHEDWPVIRSAIIAPNRLHHDKPRAFLENSWWESAWVQVGFLPGGMGPFSRPYVQANQSSQTVIHNPFPSGTLSGECYKGGQRIN
jgi:hypothetical protein